ncbi:MAG: hypothetical protein JNM85_10785 [Chthonomonas sp.]|nr:hypothetical protein [Chthonomonas sp.]
MKIHKLSLLAAIACGLAIGGCSKGKDAAMPPAKSGGVTSAAPAPGAAPSSGVTEAPAGTAPGAAPSAGVAAAPTAPTAPGTAATAGTPAPAEAQAASYDLRLIAEKGDFAKYETAMDMTMKMPQMGAPKGEPDKAPDPIKVAYSVVTDYKFLGKSDKGYTIESKLVDVKAPASTTPKGGMDMAAMAIDGVKQMKDKPVKMDVSPKGKILKQGSSVDDQASMAIQGMSQAIGFQGILFPDKPVKVGETWNSKLEFSKLMGGMGSMLQGGKMSMDDVPVETKFVRVETLNGRTIGVFEMKMNGKPKMTMSMPGDAKTKSSGMGMSMDMEISGLTTLRVDTKTGMLESSNGTTNMKMLIKMSGMGSQAGGPGGMKMEQAIKVNIKKL